MVFDADDPSFAGEMTVATTLVSASRGTEVTIVGTRASCQPMPVERIVAPAASISVARARISSHVWPPSTRSRIDRGTRGEVMGASTHVARQTFRRRGSRRQLQPDQIVRRDLPAKTESPPKVAR